MTEAFDFIELRHIVLLMAAAVSLAGLQDLLSRRISNLFPLALILLFLIAATVAGWRPDFWQNLASFALIFLIGCVLFSRHILGGGDVKLWAAVALWFKLSQLPLLILSITLAGGLLALAALARRMIAHMLARRRERVNQETQSARGMRSVPYGVAIALGTVLTISITGASLESGYQSSVAYQQLNQDLMKTISR